MMTIPTDECFLEQVAWCIINLRCTAAGAGTLPDHEMGAAFELARHEEPDQADSGPISPPPASSEDGTAARGASLAGAQPVPDQAPPSGGTWKRLRRAGEGEALSGAPLPDQAPAAAHAQAAAAASGASSDVDIASTPPHDAAPGDATYAGAYLLHDEAQATSSPGGVLPSAAAASAGQAEEAARARPPVAAAERSGSGGCSSSSLHGSCGAPGGGAGCAAEGEGATGPPSPAAGAAASASPPQLGVGAAAGASGTLQTGPAMRTDADGSGLGRQAAPGALPSAAEGCANGWGACPDPEGRAGSSSASLDGAAGGMRVSAALNTVHMLVGELHAPQLHFGEEDDEEEGSGGLTLNLDEAEALERRPIQSSSSECL